MKLLAVVLLVGTSMAVAQDNRLPNGSFETLADNGAPAGWRGVGDNLQWQTEDGNRFLRLTSTAPNQFVQAGRSIELSPDDKAYELTFRVRYRDIKSGAKSWHDGRVILNFKDADGKVISKPYPPYFRGDSKGQWKPVTSKFAVPEGAKSLEIVPALFQARSGSIDFDDFALTPIDPATLPKKYDMTSPVIPPPPAEKLPKPLHVDGNQLKDSDGNPVWLQGLSVDSLQWNPKGERTVHSIGVAIEQWKANCVRIAMKEELWWGQHEDQEDGGERYREVLDSAINAVTGRGCYVVIDLHRFRAPEQKHVDFWVEFATKYKNHPGVIFELFNEPYGITWDVWKNGGKVTEKVKQKDDVANETTEGTRTFQAVGMQAFLDAVRATGAKNVVIIGGLDFSYDLSGILNGYAIEDKGGNGVVYSTHVYPWKSKWQEKFLDVAAKHPLFIGEVGCPEKWSDFPFIKANQQKEKLGPGCPWPNDMIAVIQKHKLNWTAFSFHPKCGPKVIEDWEYTPTSYWGVYVKDALAGKQFESDKLR